MASHAPATTHDPEFDAFVVAFAAGADAAAAAEPTMKANAEGTVGSRFSDAMRQVRAQFGAIPWTKLLAVAMAVWDGITSGKTIQEIVAAVLALLFANKI